MTRNGLLPKMDVFASLGRTGYSDSFQESVNRAATGSAYKPLAFAGIVGGFVGFALGVGLSLLGIGLGSGKR